MNNKLFYWSLTDYKTFISCSIFLGEYIKLGIFLKSVPHSKSNDINTHAGNINSRYTYTLNVTIILVVILSIILIIIIIDISIKVSLIDKLSAYIFYIQKLIIKI